jgi:2',3'-cyclic-nucleotide 2'-phosphodiesterase (5'-nucleotidase family)
LLFTSDEHGWMHPLLDKQAGVERGGFVAIFDRFTRVEGYAPTPAAREAGYVLLSSGDMWTGPYESTVLEGAPMVAAMSHMNYAAAAVGNHEFDFGVRVIAERSKNARFPFLAANLVEVGSGQQPAWAKPFTIVDAGGVKLGIVGLTNVDSPVTSDPRHMTGLKFLPYVESLEEWIPKARAAGAQEVVVLIHEQMAVAPSLLSTLRRHNVRAAAFGHHHHADSRIDDNGTPDTNDDITLCNAGPYLRSYCRIDLTFVDRKLTNHDVKVTPVETPVGTQPPSQDPELVAIVKNAESSANLIGGEVLVENTQVMKRGADGAIGQFVVDAWLKALPYAQVAITNAGGLRQDLSVGPVRTRDVVSVLPFNNYLLVVDLTGAQLREILANDESIVGGVRFQYKVKQNVREIVQMTTYDGKPINDDDKLKVVINDFMYRGGDRYQFQRFDAEPEETAIDWREPVLRVLREMGKQAQKLEITPDDRAKKL